MIVHFHIWYKSPGVAVQSQYLPGSTNCFFSGENCCCWPRLDAPELIKTFAMSCVVGYQGYHHFALHNRFCQHVDIGLAIV